MNAYSIKKLITIKKLTFKPSEKAYTAPASYGNLAVLKKLQ